MPPVGPAKGSAKSGVGLPESAATALGKQGRPRVKANRNSKTMNLKPLRAATHSRGGSRMAVGTAHDKAIRLFRFLREYAAIHFPYVRDLEQVRWRMWLSDLPSHPSISVQKIMAGDEQNGSGVVDEPLIRICRPRLSQPPTPPGILKDWLNLEWDNPFKEPEVHRECCVE